MVCGFQVTEYRKSDSPMPPNPTVPRHRGNSDCFSPPLIRNSVSATQEAMEISTGSSAAQPNLLECPIRRASRPVSSGRKLPSRGLASFDEVCDHIPSFFSAPSDFLTIARSRGGASCAINSPHTSAQVGALETLAALVQSLVLRRLKRSVVSHLPIDTQSVLHLGWVTLTLRETASN